MNFSSNSIGWFLNFALKSRKQFYPIGIWNEGDELVGMTMLIGQYMCRSRGGKGGPDPPGKSRHHQSTSGASWRFAGGLMMAGIEYWYRPSLPLFKIWWLKQIFRPPPPPPTHTHTHKHTLTKLSGSMPVIYLPWIFIPFVDLTIYAVCAICYLLFISESVFILFCISQLCLGLVILFVHCPTMGLCALHFDFFFEISNNVVCATSKGSDQPAHMLSLIRAFASRLSILWLLSYWLNTIWSV